MFVFKQRFELNRSGMRDIRVCQEVEPCLCRALAHAIAQETIDLDDVLGAGLHVGVNTLPAQLSASNESQKFRQLLIVIEDDAEIAILRSIRPAMRVEDARIAWSAHRRLERVAAEMVAQQELRHRLEHRYFYDLPFARALAIEQRAQHGIH